MKRYKRTIKRAAAALSAALMLLTACSASSSGEKNERDGSAGSKSTLTGEAVILAAASLKDVCAELEALYNKSYPDVKLTFSFGSSGALQAQIEEGAPADVFISASTKQMNALKEEGKMDDESITELLENRIVLIVPEGSNAGIKEFADAATDKVKMIALGDPESVPAGQYAEEVFTSLGILDAVAAKANYGTDVRAVLSWVESGEVDCGVVYATDAYTTKSVKIVAEAPEGSCRKVIYPAGVIRDAKNREAAKSFTDFLQTAEAMKVFEGYGFAAAGR